MADSGFDNVTKRVQAIQVASKAFADGKKLEKKIGDTFERAQSNAQQSINGLKDKATKSVTDSKSQLESMLNLSQVTNSNSTTKYLKKKVC